jgi:hypothetical protein
MSAGIVLDVSSGLQGLTAAAFATQVRRLVSFAFFSGYELGSWVGVLGGLLFRAKERLNLFFRKRFNFCQQVFHV